MDNGKKLDVIVIISFEKRGEKMKVLNASSLRDTMEQRAQHYDKLRDQFTALQKAFQEIIDLDDFEGRGAEAIKAFYKG